MSFGITTPDVKSGAVHVQPWNALDACVDVHGVHDSPHNIAAGRIEILLPLGGGLAVIAVFTPPYRSKRGTGDCPLVGNLDDQLSADEREYPFVHAPRLKASRFCSTPSRTSTGSGLSSIRDDIVRDDP